MPRNIQMHIMKEKEDDGFWERLLKVIGRRALLRDCFRANLDGSSLVQVRVARDSVEESVVAVRGPEAIGDLLNAP